MTVTSPPGGGCAAAGQLRGAGAGPDAPWTVLVQGSADAIHQNLNLLRDERPEYVIVFGADHIYRMDPEQMVRQHIESGASVTVAALRVPIEQADQFGVIETAADGLTITAFPREAPRRPRAGRRPDQVYASMGNYVFSTDTRVDVVNQDADARESSHDMGGNIIPCWCSPERRTSMTSPLTTSRGRPIATGATARRRHAGRIL